MVSNRLPVDRVIESDGTSSWRASPGGLVTAIEPIVEQLGCVWIGWGGATDEHLEPFELGNMRLAPINLSEDDIVLYYEGFSNGTLWPLYHDAIAQPEFHREWWDRYRKVNEVFAQRAAQEAAEGAIVWVHDYQLQLVPKMLREKRPDLTIAFFLHIPFPPPRFFEQLPWRSHIIDGLLGADVIGFQQVGDAAQFREATERLMRLQVIGNLIVVPGRGDAPSRTVLAQEFPISIDANSFAEIASRPEVRRRAAEIREELGNPETVMLGVDRLDYTKGIRHRLKAYAELLEDGELDAKKTVLVQVASPSRERVEAYRQLRDEVETTVGRINGEHSSIGYAPLVYLHRGYSRVEMVALYLAADILLVTPLRDGMNLVAKEYAACRFDERGVLVLSEFAGAADELRDALLVNPHDIEGLKAAIVRAVHMPETEQTRRMRGLREAVYANDVVHWANGYLSAVRAAAESSANDADGVTGPIHLGISMVPRQVEDRIRRMATLPELIVASDFDGTVSPLVGQPEDARMLSRTRAALQALGSAPNTQVALLSGRSLDSLRTVGVPVDSGEWVVSGSHGAELVGLAQRDIESPLSDEERERLEWLRARFARVFREREGVRLESKPYGMAVHVRQVPDATQADEVLDAATELAARVQMHVRSGKAVREFSVRTSTKAQALAYIRALLPKAPVLFLGDDVTDEDVFRDLGPDDFGIKVGSGDTAAAARVADPQTAAAVLAMLAELRCGVVIGSR